VQQALLILVLKILGQALYKCCRLLAHVTLFAFAARVNNAAI